MKQNSYHHIQPQGLNVSSWIILDLQSQEYKHEKSFQIRLCSFFFSDFSSLSHQPRLNLTNSTTDLTSNSPRKKKVRKSFFSQAKASQNYTNPNQIKLQTLEKFSNPTFFPLFSCFLQSNKWNQNKKQSTHRDREKEQTMKTVLQGPLRIRSLTEQP